MGKITALVHMVSALSGNLMAQAGDISALGYFEYEYDSDRDIAEGNRFELNRVYFTYEADLSPGAKYKVQTDVTRDDKGRLTVYLKNAKVGWKLFGGKATLGLQGMNMFSIQEKTWGYRFIEKSAMDRKKFVGSADMGLGFVMKKMGLTTSLLVINGPGYKKPEDDRYKRLSLLTYYGAKSLANSPGTNLGAAISYQPYESDAGAMESETIVGLFGGVSGDSWRTGAEWSSSRDSGADAVITLASLYADIAATGAIHLFGRVDYLDKQGTIETYLIGGIVFSPVSGIKIAPNIRTYKVSGSDRSVTLLLNTEFKL